MNEVIQRKGKEYPVICGFYGVGKSFLVKNYPNFFDLETHFFENDQNLLFKIIKRYQKAYRYKVTIAATKENITLLQKNKIDFVVVVPSIKLHEEYMQRYRQRNGTPNFLKEMEEYRWKTELIEVLNMSVPKIILEKGQYLHDIINEIYGE